MRATWGRGRQALSVAGPGRLMRIGGEPLGEPVAIWWNDVFREPDEVRAVVADWSGHDPARFPPIPGFVGHRIPSPEWLG